MSPSGKSCIPLCCGIIGVIAVFGQLANRKNRIPKLRCNATKVPLTRPHPRLSVPVRRFSKNNSPCFALDSQPLLLDATC